MQLYDHQNDALTKLRESMRLNQSVLLQAATGFGKTACASYMLKGAHEKKLVAWFVCHRKELVEQTSKTLTRINLPHGFIAAGRLYNPLNTIFICSVDTLKNRLDNLQPPDLIIFDECHHCAATGWRMVHAWAKKGGARIVGLSATPWRLDGSGLKDFFDDMIHSPPVLWLIENGFLSKYEAFAPSTPDLSQVKSRMGDYNQEQIAQVMDNSVLFGCAVDNWKELAQGKKTIGFAPSVELSKKLAAQFRVSGVEAEHLDGTTEKTERARIIQRFADGDIQVVFNVNLFSEGFDLSAIAGRDVPIEAVILYRPTQSLSMHLQQVGRALRPKPYPAIILDHAGNLMRHGLPDMPFNWTLEGKPKKKKSDISEPPIKQCPECYLVHPAASKTCQHCGYVYPEPEGKQIEIVEGKLQRLSWEDIRENKKNIKKLIENCTTQDDYRQVAKLCGYKPGWAYYAWKDRHGTGRNGNLKESDAETIPVTGDMFSQQ